MATIKEQNSKGHRQQAPIQTPATPDQTQATPNQTPATPDRTPGKLRVGVVGLGIGRSHLKGWQSHPGVEVVAVADTDPVRLKAVATEYGVPGTYLDGQTMFAKEALDLVSICTPNAFHKPLTIAALEHGCHVLCEKPMAMNTDEARAMEDAAQRAGKRIMINFSYRFTDQSRALKAQVDKGVLGDVYFGRTVWHRRRGMPGFGGWFGTKELAGGGPLIDLGVHRLDLALWLMGNPEPEWVLGTTYDYLGQERAKKESRVFSVEDLAAGFIRFTNGASLAVEASWAANIQEAELMETRLLGTKAGLVQRNKNEAYEFEAAIYTESEGSHYDTVLHSAEGGTRTAMWHFAEAILTGQPHSPDGTEGIRIMEILDALYLSAQQGEPVKIQRRT